MSAASTAGGAPGITKRPRGSDPPLSFPQERLFLLDRITPGIPAYNVPSLMRVRATLDEDALQGALDAIVARHEILRTSIELVDGSPVPRVRPQDSVEVVVADVRGLPATEREADAMRVLAEVVGRPFDLGRDTLVRAALVHAGPDEDLLLIVHHHMASDHASSAILFAELDAHYAAALSHGTASLPELPIQYADFAAWQRQRLAGDGVDELVAYWRDQLGDAPELLELPIDHPRPPVQSHRGALREFAVPASLTERLRSVARANGVSTFMLLLAAFQTLLHRYSASEDLVVGVPVSGRHHEETMRLIGYFSNTLALRTDLSGDPRFSELLQRVRAVLLGATLHQELPFEKLVGELNPKRAPDRTPVFQVLFGFEATPAAPTMLAGQPLTQLPVPGWEWSRFDLSLVLSERLDGSLGGVFEFATDLFEPATIGRMIGHLGILLEGVADDPGRPIGELPLLTRDERAQLLDEGNSTVAAYPDACLHELIAEQARRVPDAVVQFGEERLTHGELEQRANQLAHHLRGLGVGPGVLVGICLERSLDLLVGLVGILKSGGAYVPIDPGYPAARQSYMLTQSAAPVLITHERLRDALPDHRADVVCLDRDWPVIDQQPPHAPAVEATADQLAYVIYTSGSTGNPKGVEIPHRALVNFMSAMRERPGLESDDVLVAITTLSFDIAGLELYLPLLTGARLVILPQEATLDPDELAEWLARAGATFVQATPTTWQMLVDSGWSGSPVLKIVCGGEPLSRALADELLARSAELWNMYGPTETTIWSSIHKLDPGEGPPPLGRPINNTRFYVLDRRGQPVPVGVAGELHIGGEGLAHGYHERPDLTTERFVPDPFDAGTGGRLYRTGDLVRWRADGMLEFVGRLDHQVKLRGFRIELGEIETVLSDRADVASAVAIVREDEPGDRRLVAYVVPAGAEPPTVDDLRRCVRSRLPPYMVPSEFVALDSLPLTANRKLDRGALPAPDGTRPDLVTACAPPETPVEELLASIWRQVLAIDQVGIDDDFFDLGGHSLLAVRMLARLQEELDVDVPLATIFERPTVRDLAEVVMADLLADSDEDDLGGLLAEVEAFEA